MTTTITVAVQRYTNVAFGIAEGRGPKAERAARDDAREWYSGDVATLEVIAVKWTGPAPTQHTPALGRAIDAARGWL